MSLEIAKHPNPLPSLLKERESLAAVMEEMEDSIQKLLAQFHSIGVVRGAIDNEIARIRDSEGPVQTELDFEVVQD